MKCPQCGMSFEQMTRKWDHYWCDCKSLNHTESGQGFFGDPTPYTMQWPIDRQLWRYSHARDVTIFWVGTELVELPGFVPFERCMRLAVFA